MLRADGIVWFTGLLVVVGSLQVYWMARTLSATTKALKITQRAFVFLQSFETVTLGDKLRISPKWENSGATPTRRMRNHVNWKAFSEDPPDGYSFPDLDTDGNPVSNTGKTNIPIFVGPKAVTHATGLNIPLPLVKAVAAGEIKILIWGWTNYCDVFDQPHRTEFCNQLFAQNIGETNAAIWFAVYHRHNCTDEECEDAEAKTSL